MEEPENRADPARPESQVSPIVATPTAPGLSPGASRTSRPGDLSPPNIYQVGVTGASTFQKIASGGSAQWTLCSGT